MYAFAFLLCAALLACSEPDERVIASTADGAFSVSLEAEENAVRPGDSLPVRVRVESLRGALADGLVDTVKFTVNNGQVTPSRLLVFFAPAEDSLSGLPKTRFHTWITFTASSRLTTRDQGEIHATFLDALTTLKIRIVTPAGELP